MKRVLKAGVAVLSAAVLVTAASATPAVAAPSAKQGSGGAVSTGVYPDLFTNAGYSKKAVKTKISSAWKQLFHGAPGTDANRDDGQTIMYHLNSTEAYVEDIGNQDVRTEGMGYAMMISVQLNHRAAFNDLWRFAQDKMQLKTGGEKNLFAWHTDTTGKVISTAVAPDGDQWIAAALYFAGQRWGGGTAPLNYGKQAEKILHAMWHASDSGGVNVFNSSNYLPTFSPPFAVSYTDASYALPAFYRNFAKADPTDADLWDHAATAGEKLLQTAPDATTGLAPCYSNFDGTPYLYPGEPTTDNAYNHTFQEDAWRVIANANVDAEWYGTKAWQTKYSNTLEKFFVKQGVQTYVSRYQLDGTPLAAGQNTYEPAHAQGLVAMNATSAISATNKNSTDFVRDLWNTATPSGQARYYDGMLYLLGLLYTSGNFRAF
jgi:oligosaccharide reducing-end xylanase